MILLSGYLRWILILLTHHEENKINIAIFSFKFMNTECSLVAPFLTACSCMWLQSWIMAFSWCLWVCSYPHSHDFSGLLSLVSQGWTGKLLVWDESFPDMAPALYKNMFSVRSQGECHETPRMMDFKCNALWVLSHLVHGIICRHVNNWPYMVCMTVLVNHSANTTPFLVHSDLLKNL
jgi:hypothetical protein